MVYKPELDLRLARRGAALPQSDCAHILATNQPRISKFERGKAHPSVIELAILHALFGHALDTTALQVIASRRDELLVRLKTIPDCPENWRDPQARFRTLANFADLLADLDVELYG